MELEGNAPFTSQHAGQPMATLAHIGYANKIDLFSICYRDSPALSRVKVCPLASLNCVAPNLVANLKTLTEKFSHVLSSS